MADKFITSFVKAVGIEMDAMREALGSFEVPLSGGSEMGGLPGGRFRYRFSLSLRNDKLVPGMECTLRMNGSELLVTVQSVDDSVLIIEAPVRLDPSAERCMLVIYPWFLYERLISSLESLREAPACRLDLSLKAFGKLPPKITEYPREERHGGLNGSQQRAVRLCMESDTAFVWGPPGTGKTTTLSAIVAELLSRGLRVLVTSTTNAAVDQALLEMNRSASLSERIESGEILRIGRTSPETAFAAPESALKRLNGRVRDSIHALDLESMEIGRAVADLDRFIEAAVAGDAGQFDLFGDVRLPETDTRVVETVFGTDAARALSEGGAARRLGKARELSGSGKSRIADLKDRISCLNASLHSRTAPLVETCRVILATIANVYVNPLLRGMRFDAVVIEEAGMAVLPAVFYCASLGSAKIIMMGDPRQLPPIVQSNAEYVYRAMGRNIFDVAVPDPYRSDIVALLDVQYRMHRSIGDIVSRLFYDGRIRNDPSVESRSVIAAAPPFPGKAVVLVDTAGHGGCRVEEGSYSRFNPAHAEICVRLAERAAAEGLSTAIITPYAAQAKRIEGLLLQMNVTPGTVECRTVHRFQGNERDVVILDTVDTDPLSPGVLLADGEAASTSMNLLNVSVSRAKGKLIVVADRAYFAGRGNCGLLNRLFGMIGETGVIIDSDTIRD